MRLQPGFDIIRLSQWGVAQHSTTRGSDHATASRHKLCWMAREVLVQAHAAASANCVTTVSGNANAVGCAFSEAYAEAAAYAFADAFASASSVAITKGCSCGKDIALGFADATVSLDLFASAWARAQASACATGVLPAPEWEAPLLH